MNIVWTRDISTINSLEKYGREWVKNRVLDSPVVGYAWFILSPSVIMYILLAKIFIESVHEICEIQCYLYGTVAGVVIFVRRGQHTPTPHLLEIHMEV